MLHKVRREITQKYKRKLPLIDICIKFREQSLSSFQVIERTRFVTDRHPGKNNMSPDPEGGRHKNSKPITLQSMTTI